MHILHLGNDRQSRSYGAYCTGDPGINEVIVKLQLGHIDVEVADWVVGGEVEKKAVVVEGVAACKDEISLEILAVYCWEICCALCYIDGVQGRVKIEAKNKGQGDNIRWI